MANIICIVEGHGEVEALPLLLRRIDETLATPVYPNILRSIRISASKFVKAGELERAVELAARKTGSGGAILILLDLLLL